MADSNIGALPQAAQLDDGSLLVAEQQGQAVKVTGAQFKEFGRQAVVGQVQGYVDQAQAAAGQAVDAVSAVTGMTVEAATLPSGQSATVTKSTKDGRINLAFGLPRGEQGIPGDTGPEGPRGPQGPTGRGLTILGYYDTQAALEAAVPAPEPGDAYGVGTAAPYDIYVFDGVAKAWKNNGPLSGGGGGGVLPENVVTAQGGASMTFPIGLGDGPHTITFEAEEELPLTAGDIQYSETQSVEDALDSLKASVSDGKALVASAITDKGVDTAQDATFQQMADHIGQISGGSGTSDATATSFDILAGKTAYTAAGKVEGVIPTLLAQTITPGTADKTIANGQYLGGVQTIKGDPNLTSGNIKSGVTLFGVEGALESTFQATLTVTADIGAVVTATHTNGTQVEALSTTGTVVLELPIEGTWSVTAVRGMAQYNTVVIEVSSQFSAALTAQVHIEYFGRMADLSSSRHNLAATTSANYAVFVGGLTRASNGADYPSALVDAYDGTLTLVSANSLPEARTGVAAASVGNYTMVAGGDLGKGSGGTYSKTSALTFYKGLTRLSSQSSIHEQKSDVGAAVIGDYAIFGGGNIYSGSSVERVTTTSAVDSDLTHHTIANLVVPASGCAGANDAYAIFSEGKTAYNSSLTRELLSGSFTGVGVKAGNYVLFANSLDGNVIAYDLFLTQTVPAVLTADRTFMAAATLNGFALLGRCGETYFALEIYDPYLTKTDLEATRDLYRTNGAAAAIGDYALFGGGFWNESSSRVDAYHYV